MAIISRYFSKSSSYMNLCCEYFIKIHRIWCVNCKIALHSLILSICSQNNSVGDSRLVRLFYFEEILLKSAEHLSSAIVAHVFAKLVIENQSLQFQELKQNCNFSLSLDMHIAIKLKSSASIKCNVFQWFVCKTSCYSLAGKLCMDKH